MFSGFPIPYEDELLYSVFARYEARMMPACPGAFLQELFGTDKAIATVDFPSRLNHLMSYLVPGHPCKDESFLLRHTLLAWYLPFLPEARGRGIRANTLGEGAAKNWALAGAFTHRVPAPEWLRFCPLCLREDRSEGRICYWRRLHQLTGVHVCSKHRVYLEESLFPRIPSRQKNHHVLPPEELADLTPRKIADNGQSLLLVAQLAEQLINGKWPSPGLGSLRDRHVRLLVDAGYGTRSGVVRIAVKKLAQHVQQSFPADYLQSIGCRGINWIERLVRKRASATSPILHLLPIAVTGRKLSDLFAPTEPSEPKRELERPNLICNNTVCPARGKATAAFVEEKYCGPMGGLVECYKCDTCGQTQRRCSVGYERTWVRDYGFIWHEKLAELWVNPDVSLNSIGKTLGKNIAAVKGQAIKGGLALPRPGQVRTSVHGYEHLLRDKAKLRQAKVQQRRKRWLSLRAKYPGDNLRRLRSRNGAIYAFLDRYDQQWLRENQPASRRWWPKGKPRADWEKRDQILLQELKKYAKRLRGQMKPDQLLAPGVLAKAVGYRQWMTHRLDRLPKSRLALVHLADSTTVFAFRHLVRVADMVLFCDAKSKQPQAGRDHVPRRSPSLVKDGKLVMLKAKLLPDEDKMFASSLIAAYLKEVRN